MCAEDDQNACAASDYERMSQQTKQRINAWTQTVIMPGQKRHTFWQSVQQDLIRTSACM